MTDRHCIRLVLLSKFPVVRAGLLHLLGAHPGFEVAGEAASVADAVALVERIGAEVVLIDPDSDDVSLRAVSEVSQACDARILVLTDSKDSSVYTLAIELGAAGVVAKEQAAHLIVRAIEKVHAGEMWLDRETTAKVLLTAVRGVRDPELLKIQTLTNREREIVGRVGEGLSNAAIGDRLFISEATVRNHLTSILSKLALANRFELAVYAFRHHLAPHPAHDGHRQPGAATGDRGSVRVQPNASANGNGARREGLALASGRRVAASGDRAERTETLPEHDD